jgi:peptide/nickel transport system permease protein
MSTTTTIDRRPYTPIDQASRKKAEARTQAQLIWRDFKRHRLAIVSLIVLGVLYFVGVGFPGFFAPHGKFQEFDDAHLPPQRIRFVDAEGQFHLVPFVYNYIRDIDPETWQPVITVDRSTRYHLRLFVRGAEYRVFGVFPANLHLWGVESGGLAALWGTDKLGRDLFSRTIYALRPSLTIGFVGVGISLVLGLILGGISGLAGGAVDDIIQRVVEAMLAVPKIPLWMALAAAVPAQWGAIQVYFAITVILSLMGWTGVARVVRSKFMALREEDFVTAARGYNAPSSTIIARHLIPNFISYVIVNLTLAIPGMIIGETSLSFLGIGLRPPVVSLGVLLSQAQSFQTVAIYPWLLIPGAVVVIVVLAFNFVGDGIRDAADPYN